MTAHLRWPLRLVDGVPQTVEQDSYEDLRQCVRTILSFAPGQRIELPEFGLVDQVLREGGADLEAIRRAIADWEPRADALVSADPAALADLVSDVRIAIGGAA